MVRQLPPRYFPRRPHTRTPKLLFLSFALFLALCALEYRAVAQDTVFTQATSGAPKIRIAVADFKPANADPQTSQPKAIFDSTLYADLGNAGIFDLVSKSLLPSGSPGVPSDVHLQSYSDPPAGAAFLTFGSIGVVGGKLIVSGFLFDAKNLQYPQVLAKQYPGEPTEDSARQIAHQFADEIIVHLGGLPGICESKIYYVKEEGGTKEIWAMDYDGANQHAITHLGTVSMGPRVSPDNSRIAFESLGRNGFQVRMYSLLLGRMVNFPSAGGTNITPAWSPDGNHIAYSSSRTGDPEIWVSDSNGALSQQITHLRGPDASPTYNPRTGAQIAWISGRTGLPQLYVMNSDGTAIQQMTDGGYVSSPSWSPDGQWIAYAWDRKYGPGAPGGEDIYIINIASKSWKQLTHDSGHCDFPSWSPDGRHLVYACSSGSKSSSSRIYSLVIDLTSPPHAITGSGADMPNWSWK